MDSRGSLINLDLVTGSVIEFMGQILTPNNPNVGRLANYQAPQNNRQSVGSNGQVGQALPPIGHRVVNVPNDAVYLEEINAEEVNEPGHVTPRGA
mgnify:CR=1 FL=1